MKDYDSKDSNGRLKKVIRRLVHFETESKTSRYVYEQSVPQIKFMQGDASRYRKKPLYKPDWLDLIKRKLRLRGK